MQDLFLEHLSEKLSDSGRLAYIWYPEDDRFDWAGDVVSFLGLNDDDKPLTKRSFHTLLNPQSVPERLSALHDMLEGREQTTEKTLIYKIRRANGSHITVRDTMSLKDGKDGRLICGLIEIRDEDELADPGAEAFDPFAGIAGKSRAPHEGRYFLRETIERYLESETFADSGMAFLLVIGMDRISLMNHAFGPSITDDVIERTGRRLECIAKDSGYTARIDGDVFALFFHASSACEMAAMGEHILQKFYEEPISTEKGPFGVSLSIGGCIVNRDLSVKAGTFVTRADMAMRVAKERGRNCFVPYNDEYGTAGSSRKLLKAGEAFIEALKNKKVMLAFQPVISSASQKASFHESLVRMVDNDGKLVPAGEFMPAVEKLGLCRLVDQYSLSAAIEELSLFPELTLSVNVSNLTLLNQDWLRGLVTRLGRNPSIASRLIIEITESAAMQDIRRTSRIVKTLKDIGCRVALDDFGAGYTAFSQMKMLDVDIVKIDKSFTRNIDEEENRLFVKTLQMLASGLDIETVGEGAETMEDARILMDGGIDHVQGYVYGFPQTERVWLPKDHAHRYPQTLREEVKRQNRMKSV